MRRILLPILVVEKLDLKSAFYMEYRVDDSVFDYAT